MNAKTLGIVALVLAAAALSANLYAVIETLPNYKYTEAALVKEGSAITARLLESYRGTLKQLALTAVATGALAVVLGGLAGKKGWKAGFAAAAVGLAAIGWQFVWVV